MIPDEVIQIILTISGRVRERRETLAGDSVGGDDRIVQEGIRLLRQMERPAGVNASTDALIAQVAHMRAMIEILLVEAVELRARVRRAELGSAEEERRAGELEREYGHLQEEARRRDPSLLDGTGVLGEGAG